MYFTKKHFWTRASGFAATIVVAALTKSDNPFSTSLLLSYAVGEYIKAEGTASPLTDGRMTVIGGVTP
ncbi:MAG: hypothetical protein LBL31_07760 [Spirochaetaceae bacterium]|nr:hypothetical protein [Spirochaetaceae bacterium]